MSNDIPLFKIAWDGDDVKNVVDSITRGGFWANGPYIDQFENCLRSYYGVDHALVFNSGTSALIAALDAHGIGEGDEVIVPSFTFISTANAVKIVGAEPVFADIERDRYGLDPGAVEAAITEDTAGILPVHYAGKPCKVHALKKLADEHDLLLVEDAAEAFGAKIDGQPVGAIGDSAILSFCQNKVITTGEGGALLTDNNDVATRARLVRSHGRASTEYFDSASTGDYVSLGQNYRMPDVVAAIGVAQMNKCEDIIDRRRSVAHRYSELISGIDGVEPPNDLQNGRHVYQLYTITLKEGIDRDSVIEELAAAGIASKVYFDPVHLSTFYREQGGDEPSSLPTTESVSGRVLSLPMDPDMGESTALRVIDELEAAVTAST